MGYAGAFSERYRATDESMIWNQWLQNRPRTRVALMAIYYLGVIVGLVLLYGRGDFSTPSFVYQGF